MRAVTAKEPVLPFPDIFDNPGDRALTEAEGYDELGMFQEAHAELDVADEIPELRMEVAIRKFHLLIEEKRWEEAVPYGEALCDIDPDDLQFARDYALVCRELGREVA